MHVQIAAGTWISCRKGRIIYRGQLLLEYDSITKPDVKITSDLARCGYRYLRAPLEIYVVGKTVIRSRDGRLIPAALASVANDA